MMPVLIGSSGVGLLLLAYGLNLFGRWSQLDRSYLLMNVAGSAMAAWYAWMGANFPFLVLEGVWALTSVVRLANRSKEKGPSQTTRALD